MLAIPPAIANTKTSRQQHINYPLSKRSPEVLYSSIFIGVFQCNKLWQQKQSGGADRNFDAGYGGTSVNVQQPLYINAVITVCCRFGLLDGAVVSGAGFQAVVAGASWSKLKAGCLYLLIKTVGC
ncbi:hypothetical protein [Ferruginibacter sp.]|uniref:hypothetical protein n=1 Tax=Ferruginibacter sp. TaxID=1940288 RepID=UPI002657B5F6|nr:hypothetical protein [Ferruginibacter sp.]